MNLDGVQRVFQVKVEQHLTNKQNLQTKEKQSKTLEFLKEKLGIILRPQFNEKQESHAHEVFASLRMFTFIMQLKCYNQNSPFTSALKSSFSDVVTDDYKIVFYFSYLFVNMGGFLCC